MKAFFILILSIVSIDIHSAELQVNVLGLNQTAGQVFINLFAAEAGYPDDPQQAQSRHKVSFDNAVAVLTLKDLQQGQYYALSVCHDENQNGRCDTNFLGIPSEGVGVSNNARGSFGPPKFKDARFLMQTLTRQQITVRY